MAAIVLTEPEHAEVLAHSDVADPARRGRTVGASVAVARINARIPASYSRVADGTTPPLGWSVSNTYERDTGTGEVEVEPEDVYRLLDEPGADLSVATADILIAGVGEMDGSNRRFSLRFAFARTSMGR